MAVYSLQGDLPVDTISEFKFGDHVEASDDGEQWWPAVYIRQVDGNRPHELLLKCPWSGRGNEYWAKYCRKAEW